MASPTCCVTDLNSLLHCRAAKGFSSVFAFFFSLCYTLFFYKSIRSGKMLALLHFSTRRKSTQPFSNLWSFVCCALLRFQAWTVEIKSSWLNNWIRLPVHPTIFWSFGSPRQGRRTPGRGQKALQGRAYPPELLELLRFFLRIKHWPKELRGPSPFENLPEMFQNKCLSLQKGHSLMRKSQKSQNVVIRFQSFVRLRTITWLHQLPRFCLVAMRMNKQTNVPVLPSATSPIYEKNKTNQKLWDFVSSYPTTTKKCQKLYFSPPLSKPY